MSSVEPYQRTGAMRPSREPRWLTKSLNTVQAGTSVALARVEATAEVQAVKTDAVAYVTGRALHSVTMISTLETQLAQSCPHASGRLALIADMASLSLADLVQQTAHRLRGL